MALPAIPAVIVTAGKVYSAFKTAKGAADTASKLAGACKGASAVLSQAKMAIDTFDGGVFSSSSDGGKGQAIDMHKLEGVITEPGKVPLGMNSEESSFYQDFLLNMMNMNDRAMAGPSQSPNQDGPSGPSQ